MACYIIYCATTFVKTGYYNSGYSKSDWLDMPLGKKYDALEHDRLQKWLISSFVNVIWYPLWYLFITGISAAWN